ncbi:serine protease persephone [Harpegnathos saltator]|uniref:serine protease persephone n=1 Tax=Harpegnathos saltator TaxID=610380 RepID=UPI000DBEE895|nr:serine protease persephone [Harpegnathos saltator]XP_025160822.1 serine protease persephone [Harpegnathos saltator]
MPTGVASLSLTLLTLLLSLILSPIYGKDVGEGCTISNSSGFLTSGVCKLLEDCPPVYDALLAGNSPTTCGFIHFKPIVCCPTNNENGKNITTERITSKLTTSSTERISTPRTLIFDNSRGSLARAKCAENAVDFDLKLPGTMNGPMSTRIRKRQISLFITGGKKAVPKEFPHMTAIGFENGENKTLWLCGGSLISDRVVLTAAHCIYNQDWGVAKWVRVGDLNLARMNDSANPQTIRIVERISHPDYKRPSVYHDIAIMKLETPVTYTAWARPACLPVDLPDTGTDGEAVATGWGRVDWAAEHGSDNLLKVTLSLIPQQSCNESFFDADSTTNLAQGIVGEWQICAGEEEKGTCPGDSGGPLAVFNPIHDNIYNIIGITSVGRLCGSIVPTIYTRVYHYIPWIEKVTWPEYFKNNQEN